MKKAFVTGATGFVGAAVARALLADGWQVRALARAGADRRNFAGLPLEVATGDLRDRQSLFKGLMGCDTLFHVAADYRLWAPDPADLYAINVEGTRNVLEAAAQAGVERVVHTSSVATIRLHPDGRAADEGDVAVLSDMIGHYKRSKFLGEAVAREWAEAGHHVVIVNPSTPVGPRDVKPTPTGRIVLDTAAGRMPAYVDTGLNIAHVDDIARGHLLALDKGRSGERYILGGENLALRDILACVAGIVGRKPPSISLPHGAVMPIAYIAEAFARLTGRSTNITVEGVRMARKKMYFSSARAEQVLGYHHRPPQAAFEDAVDWFQSQGMLRSVRQ